MTNRAKEMKGDYGHLMVLGRAGTHPTRGGALWRCRCECGNEKVVEGRLLRDGTTVSCGCLVGRASATHGDSKSPTYTSWRSMLKRCYSKKHRAYHNYGGRGIKVCDRWKKDYVAFLSDMGPRPRGKSLDRRRNNEGYSPDNCYWATAKEQQRNRRNNRLVTVSGRTQTVAAWAEEVGMKPTTLYKRLRYLSSDKAISLPLVPRSRRGIKLS